MHVHFFFYSPRAAHIMQQANQLMVFTWKAAAERAPRRESVKISWFIKVIQAKEKEEEEVQPGGAFCYQEEKGRRRCGLRAETRFCPHSANKLRRRRCARARKRRYLHFMILQRLSQRTDIFQLANQALFLRRVIFYTGKKLSWTTSPESRLKISHFFQFLFI